MKTLRRPSPALIISLVALFVALGGTTYAATSLPKNSVGTAQLKNTAVTSTKIRNGAVVASKINARGLTVPNAHRATSALNAVIAKNATNATNATMLGGFPSGGYLRVGATLPSGATETGAWGFGSDNASVPYQAAGYPVFSFAVPLAAELDGSHTIYVVGGSSSPHCSGPGHADAGYLCVYQGEPGGAVTPVSSDIFNPELGSPHPGSGAGTWGWGIRVTASVPAAGWFAGGSYAVTAP